MSGQWGIIRRVLIIIIPETVWGIGWGTGSRAARAEPGFLVPVATTGSTSVGALLVEDFSAILARKWLILGLGRSECYDGGAGGACPGPGSHRG